MSPAKRLHRHGDPHEAATGSAGLWAAVLLDALETLNGRGLDHGAVAQAQARHWFFESTEHGPGSFRWTCDVLGLEPAAVRRALERGH
jgi:hypothetical protein